MAQGMTYRDYWSSEEFNRVYNEYQRQYATRIRESDRTLIEVIRGLLGDIARRDEPPGLLDIGCSTGNFLLHLKHALPGVELFGGDIVESAVAEAQRNPQLEGIRLEVMDLFRLGQEHPARFDLVTANAVFYVFADDEFTRAVRNVAGALRPGGWLVVFDLFNPFDQDLAILEKSILHPEGHPLHVRAYSTLTRALQSVGFDEVEIQPFRIPIDLPKPEETTDTRSYTRTTVDGERLLLRGSILQPWCHVAARRAVEA